MIDRRMLVSFTDELETMEKEAQLGAIKSVASGAWKGISKLLGRGSKAGRLPPKAAPVGGFSPISEMNRASREAALGLRGPIGGMYRGAAGVAKPVRRPVPVPAKLTAGGAKPAMPGAQPTAGTTVAGGGAPVQVTGSPLAGVTRPKGIITAQASRAAPTRATLGSIPGGAGISPSMYPKGKMLGVFGGKPVFAHIMRKFAALHYDTALATRLRS